MASSHALFNATNFSLRNYKIIYQLIQTGETSQAKARLETEIRILMNTKKTIDKKIAAELIGLITWTQTKCLGSTDEIRLHVQQAMVYELQGEYDLALEKYAAIRENFTINIYHAYIYAADILIKKKNYQEAEVLLHALLRQNLTKPEPIPDKQTKKAEEMLEEIARRKYKFSKAKPMHVFFAEIAVKARLEQKARLDSTQQEFMQFINRM